MDDMRVLVFPPINNYRRFLIHKLVDEQFPTLTTFSIGGGDDRRPVICFKTDYIQPQIKKAKTGEDTSRFTERTLSTESQPPCQIQPKRERRTNAMPSIGIYRPPAARRLEEQNANAQEREPISDSLNGKHDCKCPSDVDQKSDGSGISLFKNAISSIRTQKTKEITPKKTESCKTNPLRQRRPDMKVYVPKARRIAFEQAKPTLPKEEEEENSCYSALEPKGPDVLISGELNTEHITKASSIECSDISNGSTVQKEVHQLSPASLWVAAENEVNESKPASQRTVPTESGSSDSSGTDSLKGSLEKICDKKEKGIINSAHANPDDCDWDTMFDDSGECLHPSLIEQLSSAVGEVTIQTPKSNYDSFKTKTLDMVNDEFPHVVEIYNFPPEFRLRDLMTVFSQFKNAGFEIKWVDDTHALGVFGNSQIVSEVLAFRHPFVKTRLLKDGTTVSKAKARKCAEQLLPYKPRPDTCPALARRLVTGALGVKLPTSREEREAEKKILSQAREKKRLEAKQREEAWEGTFH